MPQAGIHTAKTNRPSPQVQQIPPCFLSSWAHRAETLNADPSGSSGRIISVYSATLLSRGGLEMEPLSAPSPGA